MNGFKNLNGLLLECKYMYMEITPLKSCPDPEGGQGGLDPLKNKKKIGFLSNTGSYPHEKNHKAANASIQYSVIINTPVKRHLNGVS